MKVSRVTQNTRTWRATIVTRRGHNRSECWFRKKKQPNANVIELVEGDKKQCVVLSVTDRPVGNKDRWVIDSRCSQHIVGPKAFHPSFDDD